MLPSWRIIFWKRQFCKHFFLCHWCYSNMSLSLRYLQLFFVMSNIYREIQNSTYTMMPRSYCNCTESWDKITGDISRLVTFKLAYIKVNVSSLKLFSWKRQFCNHFFFIIDALTTWVGVFVPGRYFWGQSNIWEKGNTCPHVILWLSYLLETLKWV